MAKLKLIGTGYFGALVAAQATKIVAGTAFTGGLGTVGGLAVADVLSTGTGAAAGGTYDVAAADAVSKADQLAADLATIMAQVTDGTDIVGILSLDPDDLAILLPWRVTSGREDATTTAISLDSLGLKGPLIFANLAALTSLDLSGNTTMINPPDLTTNVALTYLGLNGNTAMIAPPDLTTNVALTYLYLYGNTAMINPPDLTTNVALTTLDLNGNTAMIAPPDVSLNVALTTLSLYGCTSLNAADLDTLFGYLDAAATGGLTGCEIDVSGIVSPTLSATWGIIYDLVTTHLCTVVVDAPTVFVMTQSGATPVSPAVLGDFTYAQATARWDGDGTAPAYLYHNGSNWQILETDTSLTWTGHATNPVGVYTPDGAAGSIDVAIPV